MFSRFPLYYIRKMGSILANSFLSDVLGPLYTKSCVLYEMLCRNELSTSVFPIPHKAPSPSLLRAPCIRKTA